MKILLYGEYWEGTHIDCISKVLEKKKINYKIFDFFSILNGKSGSRLADKIIRRLKYSQNEATINKLLASEIDSYRPTVLFISKGLNIYPETLQLYRDSGIMVVNWNPDDFFNPNNSSRFLLDSLGIYDIVFSARKHLFNEYRSAGISNPKYLEWYYIPWLHVKPEIDYVCQRKITFVGTYSKRRESIIKSIPTFYPIEIWGSGWNFSPLIVKKHIKLHGSILSQREFPSVMSSSLVNLNILTLENRDLTNLKLFEITASYGLMLTEYQDISNDIFRIDRECYSYSMDQPRNLEDKLDFIFNKASVDELKQVQNAGFTVVHQNGHSIFDRVEDIIITLKS